MNYTPYVRVTNQQEFEKVVEKMERETGLKTHYSTNRYDSVFSAIGIYNYEGEDSIFMLNPNHYENKHLKTISAHEYLTGAKETFTLSDLTDGMVIEYRKGDRRLFMQGSLIGDNLWGDSSAYKENLTYKYYKFDIVKVYTVNSFRNSFKDLFSDHNLTLIFNAESHRRKLEIEAELKRLQEELDALEVGNHE